MASSATCDTCIRGTPMYALSKCSHKLCAACVNGNLSHDLVLVQMMIVECPRCKHRTEFDVKIGLPRFEDQVAVQYLQAYT